ncbi:oxygen-independent coproporphyrinogen III oxidase [Kaistia algarum]|uniref:oxygen-independent coproporphyrinogen III oxidase n=1 Tax=Kaistia algarum TaxID=2083279 RepID=UPI000CE73413|nr:oxygen-independent coproporphyrinogen III oxidase [Kaistia algarum]MCX5514643.1 oxygen-independent coproporphyrinogen III oxidase [Kaistia algarum]PPE78924.1 oxygen-independent coproporphyrinogen III oxidase [Kaistia algarum]
MKAVCELKSDCVRWSPSSPAALIEKYDGRVPRYTSYPTAPHFHAGIGETEYRRWLGEVDPAKPLSLYLHVPFCRQLCWYCGCNTQVTNRQSAISDYVDALLGEISLVQHAIGKTAPVSSIHLGGGTPNALWPRDLDRLFSALRGHFSIDSGCEIAAELDPRTLDHAWIDAAVANGLNRASLGVQDLDPRVQSAINRIQPLEVTVRAVEHLRRAGVESINLDLMYGLPHQTSHTIARTVADIVGIKAERIALFGYAHVPWMKPAQKLIPDSTLPGAVERFDQQALAAELLVEAGYVQIGLDHFALEDDRLAQSLRKGDMRRNFQGYTTDRAETLIGFGASSIGRLPQGYVQNAVRITDWRDALAEGRLPVAKGIEFSRDDRVVGSIIETLMCLFRIDLDEVSQGFGLAADSFDDELSRLQPFEDDGLVLVRGRNLFVTERGRPFVRSICAVFDRYFDRAATRHSRSI